MKSQPEQALILRNFDKFLERLQGIRNDILCTDEEVSIKASYMAVETMCDLICTINEATRKRVTRKDLDAVCADFLDLYGRMQFH